MVNSICTVDNCSASSNSAESKNTSSDCLVYEFVSNCNLNDQRLSLHAVDGSCPCVWPDASLVKSGSLDAEATLKVPVPAAPFLAIDLEGAESGDTRNDADQTSVQHPLQGSPVVMATLIDRRKLTKEGAAKHKYEIIINFENSDTKYEPGDAFYFVIPNVDEEVEWLLKRLKLDDIANRRCKVKLLENTARKNANVPAHLYGSHSLRSALTNSIDIRRPVSKGLLRWLAEACGQSGEKRRLLELVSTSGASEYEKFIRTSSLSILDILHAFPSCTPPIERLLEHLPPLQPRPYSVASYGLNGVRFVYSLVSIPAGNGRFYHREGLATGLLTRCPVGAKIRIFLKKPSKFQLLREHAKRPLIMIGPGTGVAPFIGFLERISAERMRDPTAFENVWLFFGCKNEKLDFVFREELENFRANGDLNQLHVSFSRDDASPFRYIQDLITRYGKEFCQLVLDDPRPMIYVCGDAKNLAPDIFKAICAIISEHGGKTEAEAVAFCRQMQEAGRYLQDVWT